MFSHVLAWSSDARILHLSVEHFQSDSHRAIGCLNAFLGNRGLPKSHLKMLFQEFHANSRQTEKFESKHFTTGKYNDSNVEAKLRSSLTWSKDFASARSLLETVFEREAQMYDCPHARY